MINIYVNGFLKKVSTLFLLYIIITPVSAQNNSIWTIDSSTLNTLPFRGENNLYYTLFPGVTSQDFRGNDLLHIRGSRHDELAYYINGIDIRSDYTGLPLFRIIPQALNNITIDKAPGVGTSNARVAITHALKQGDEYTFSINGETDKFTPLYEQRLGTYSYGYNNLTLTGGGIIPKIGTQFFIAGEREKFVDHYRMFWDGFHITDKDMELEFITNVKWTEVDTGYVYSYDVLEDIDELLVKPGNIPKANLGRTTLNATITQPFPNGSVSFIALYEDATKRINNTPIKHMFNQQRLPETNRKAQLYSLQGEYTFPLDIKLKLQADFMRSNESTYDPNFGENFLKYSDSTALANKNIPYYGLYRYKMMNLNQFSFDMPGNLISGYEKREESYSNINFNLSKIFNSHTIKLGGHIKNSIHRYYSISNYALNNLEYFYKWDGWTRSTVPKDVFEKQLFWNHVQGVGYNLEGQAVDKKGAYYEAPKKPKHLSFYLSDTYKIDRWELDFGLRYDSFYSDAFVIQDSAIVDFGGAYVDYYYGFTGNEPIEKQQANNSWSPRLHITHQINNSLLLFSKFGKYVQFPQLSDVYTNKVTRLMLVNGQNFITDLRSNETKPVSSYQTSIGFNYITKSNWRINAEIFGVTGSNQLQSDNITLFNNGEPSNNYPVFKSEGESQIVGLELDLRYNTDKIDAMLNYSYSYVKGTSSYPISNYPFTWNVWDTTTPKSTNQELEYNNRHSGMAFVAYKYGEDENIFLKNTIISMLGRFDTGHPYVLWDAGFGGGFLYEGGLPNHSNVRILNNPNYGNTTPWRFSIDLKIDKTIKIGKTGKITFYAYAQNILNKKNINHVHWRTGNTVDDGAKKMFNDWNLQDSEWFDYDNFIKLYELINIDHRQHYRNSEGGDLFGRPREIRFGVSFNY